MFTRKCWNILMFLAILFLAGWPGWADVIRLKSGLEMEGRIKSRDEEKVVLDFYGVDLTFYADEMTGIEKDGISTDEDENPAVDSAGTKVFLPGASDAAQPVDAGQEIRYTMTKTFLLKVQASLLNMQYHFPIVREDVPGLTIISKTFSPRPNAVTDDVSGNKIANYYFSNPPGGKQKEIQVTYELELDGHVPAVDDLKGRDLSPEQKADLRSYFQSEGYIDVAHPDIVRTSLEIVEGQEGVYDKAKALYDYLVQNMVYDKEREGFGQQKPHETLYTLHGVCIDIAVLFVTMARAAGVPARLVQGVGFQMPPGEKKISLDVGHAWAEFFSPSGEWLAVDPTWGLTRPDDYFCFVYREHIPENYGQINSRDPGSLYNGSGIMTRSRQHFDRMPVERTYRIDVERMD